MLNFHGNFETGNLKQYKVFKVECFRISLFIEHLKLWTFCSSTLSKICTKLLNIFQKASFSLNKFCFILDRKWTKSFAMHECRSYVCNIISHYKSAPCSSSLAPFTKEPRHLIRLDEQNKVFKVECPRISSFIEHLKFWTFCSNILSKIHT
jgi:hypothetical protein